jgi:hypothetical protein
MYHRTKHRAGDDNVSRFPTFLIRNAVQLSIPVRLHSDSELFFQGTLSVLASAALLVES